MSVYSKQTFYCNACGRKLFIEYEKLYGRDFKVCPRSGQGRSGDDCVQAMQLKRAKSIMGEPEEL